MEMNSFLPANTLGQRISGQNVLTVDFYSATPSDTVAAGTAVKLVATTPGLVSKVSVLSASTEASIGVVLSKPMHASFAVGEKIEIGMENTILPMTAGGNFNAGTELEFNPTTKKVVTKSSGAKIGVALENGVTDALVRVYLQK
jgi:hypothetical protein